MIPWLPEELGGINASHVDSLVLNDEFLQHGANAGASLMTPGASIAASLFFYHGTQEHKKQYLPRIARGEIEICMGYTEPSGGTDLASLQMQAVEDGDDYIVNGQKIFNTHAHMAEYHLMMVRTDPLASKHRGISWLVVDLKSPGITVRPILCLGGERTNEVFYDNVRVPKKKLVGDKNQGFYHAVTALGFERSIPSGGLRWLLDRIIEFPRQPKLVQDPIVRHKLAAMAIDVEVASLIEYRIACLLDEGKMPPYEPALLKVILTESYHHMTNEGLQIMGLFGLVTEDSAWASLAKQLQQFYQRTVAGFIGGGTNDMLRSYVVTRGIGLARAW
jgi:alkylation response protein AidB-like acyl-CoA dehydrogenase